MMMTKITHASTREVISVQIDTDDSKCKRTKKRERETWCFAFHTYSSGTPGSYTHSCRTGFRSACEHCFAKRARRLLLTSTFVAAFSDAAAAAADDEDDEDDEEDDDEDDDEEVSPSSSPSPLLLLPPLESLLSLLLLSGAASGC